MNEMLLTGPDKTYYLTLRGRELWCALGGEQALLQRDAVAFGADMDKQSGLHALVLTGSGGLYYHTLGWQRRANLLAPPTGALISSPEIIMQKEEPAFYYTLTRHDETHLICYRQQEGEFTGKCLYSGNDFHLVYVSRGGDWYLIHRQGQNWRLTCNEQFIALLPCPPTHLFLPENDSAVSPLFGAGGLLWRGGQALFLGNDPAFSRGEKRMFFSFNGDTFSSLLAGGEYLPPQRQNTAARIIFCCQQGLNKKYMLSKAANT